MSDTNDLDQLLNNRGQSTAFGAYVTAACFDPATAQPAFALGDGTLRLGAGGEFTAVAAHQGAVLSLCAHPLGGFLSGGDDGRLMRTQAGEATQVQKFGSKWVEHVAAFTGKTSYLAAAVGKIVHLLSPAGDKLRELAHPSTVTGLAFDAKGKRLATSHYNGASLWFTASASAPKVLEWKGSHTGIVMHPNGEAVVTMMQENALHGWTLPEGKHMRMSGYPSKTESLSFTKSGRWLATAGAESVVLWPFFGGGPMGKAPKELGMGDGIVKRVACHPEYEVVAAGFDTGMVLMIDINREQVLPVCGPGRGAVSALAWNANGAQLAIGTETGFAALVDFATK
ncbi:WD40 repeat domain-containing protein [Acidocella sp. KAb 2-4]|uniref:WD40 repeat domain-containing protein n=1 Tax=Acidocella sp. KAb 2-4 TaxID=2885158 RepID=UPI001D06427C|nr:WD40 repeat domain-containing protein [Acidocella sp. KAb 2-4]MCB5945493.1 WD40 repeat domain-containing protein [Acidocella sp. KAb 2-4]